MERGAAAWNIPIAYGTHAKAEVHLAAHWVVVISRDSLLTARPPEKTLRFVVRESQEAVPNREGREASGPAQP